MNLHKSTDKSRKSSNSINLSETHLTVSNQGTEKLFTVEKWKNISSQKTKSEIQSLQGSIKLVQVYGTGLNVFSPSTHLFEDIKFY